MEFFPDFENIISTNSEERAHFILNILKKARELNPLFFHKNPSFHIITQLEFDPDWGWGSSSSLIVNLARWVKISPFKLHKLVSRGSGYDIAAALSNQPILFRKTELKNFYRETTVKDTLTENSYFIYLKHKKNTEQELMHLDGSYFNNSKLDTITEITLSLLNEDDTRKIHHLLHQHEEIISSLIGKPSVQSLYFSDFPGTIKSLGAWGGDFIMAFTEESYSSVKEYFASKGYPVIFKWKEIGT